MLWSRKGASHLLAVRCALLSGWFEDFWKHYNPGCSRTRLRRMTNPNGFPNGFALHPSVIEAL
jgi:hypothetical protein